MEEKILDGWIKKHPFLEKLLHETSLPIFNITEEEGIEKILHCRTNGYDSTQGENTSWSWYFVEQDKLEELKGSYVGDAIIGKNFDYLVSIDYIRNARFEDKTISIYRKVGE
jgi:hypothetical protein